MTVSKEEIDVDSVAEASMDQLIHTKQWNIIAKIITTGGNHDSSGTSQEQMKQLDQLTLLLEQLDADCISPEFLANVLDCISKFLQEYRHDSTNISSIDSSSFISFKQEFTKVSQSQQAHIVQFINTAIDSRYVHLSEDELQLDIQNCLQSTYGNGKESIRSSFWKLTDAKVDLRNLQESTDEISKTIFASAQFLSDGIKKNIVPNINKGIQSLGQIVVENTSPHDGTSTSADIKDYMETSEAALQTTDSLRQNVKSISFGIRDLSTRKIHEVSNYWKENQIGKQLVQDDEMRETIVSGGKIAMAALGASALLVESLVDTTTSIGKTSVDVVSQVVEHQKGQEAGRLVKNAGQATGNVLRTVTHVGMLEGQVLTKSIARNSAKVGMSQGNSQPLDGQELSKEHERKESRELEMTETEKEFYTLLNKPKDLIKDVEEKLPAIVDTVKQNIIEQEEKLKEGFTEIVRANMELLELNDSNTKVLDTCSEKEESENSITCNNDNMEEDDSSETKEGCTNSFQGDVDEEISNNDSIEDSNSTHDSGNATGRIEERNEVISQGIHDFLPLHTKYEEKDWIDLPVQAQQAADVLGLTQELWDAKGWCPCEDKGWYGLSEEEQIVASLLGWDRPSWDTQYDDFDWVDLPQHVKDASVELGFDQHMWDHDEWPRAIQNKMWQELGERQKLCLHVLGYTKYVWDGGESNSESSSGSSSDSEMSVAVEEVEVNATLVESDIEESVANVHEVDDILEYEYIPLPLHTKYQDHKWTNLPPMIQEAAGVIGLNQESWDSQANIQCDDKDWYDLSHDEREAASTLGWDEDAWDQKYENKEWHELPEHVKLAAKCLGFERYTWDHDELPHELESRHWQDLTDGEQCLLYVLGYSKHTWDENDSSIESSSREEESDEHDSESSEDSESEYDSSTIATVDSQHSLDEDGLRRFARRYHLEDGSNNDSLQYEDDSQGETEIQNNVSMNASAMEESDLPCTTIETNHCGENNLMAEYFETAIENEDEKDCKSSSSQNETP
ncbi:hypothetical protein CTEN210_12276 [Chaetoceros tenuissimus]|uniref:Senescence domain-containing protein n=1 Tax=Chaetoceros tenuissimus TaxID=426638 RepID=A0AAD3D311_9STRA|nr:hypothetical protein CTEN210_12276 [Chaetoceros tenuissimus]